MPVLSEESSPALSPEDAEAKENEILSPHATTPSLEDSVFTFQNNGLERAVVSEQSSPALSPENAEAKENEIPSTHATNPSLEDSVFTFHNNGLGCAVVGEQSLPVPYENHNSSENTDCAESTPLHLTSASLQYSGWVRADGKTSLSNSLGLATDQKEGTGEYSKAKLYP